MKKILLMSIILITVLYSCQKSQNHLEMLKQKVESNKNFISYVENVEKFQLKTLSGEISLKNADKDLINKEYSKVKNLEELKKLFKEARVKGAEDFAIINFETVSNMQKLINDMPELKELNEKQFKYVLSFKTNVSKKTFSASDINSSLK